MAREAFLLDAGRELPLVAEEHLHGCPGCRAEVDEIGRVDAALSTALGGLRARIRGPDPEEIDRILSAVRETPPAAVLLGRIRRSVKRMLLLTLLVLSFLLVALAAWGAFALWKAMHG